MGGDAGVGRIDEGTAASQHVAYTWEGHRAGGNRQEVPVLEGLQVSQERQQISRKTGSRSSEIPYGDFRARLLLAPSSGMQICNYTVHKP